MTGSPSFANLSFLVSLSLVQLITQSATGAQILASSEPTMHTHTHSKHQHLAFKARSHRTQANYPVSNSVGPFGSDERSALASFLHFSPSFSLFLFHS